MTELSGVRVLVVGATGGLGSRIARRLSDAGAVLALSGRDAGRLDALGIAADNIVADLRPGSDSGSGSAQLVAEAESRLGGLDALVIASGVVAFGAASETDPATVAELFETNVVSPIELIGAAHAALARSATEGRSPVVVTLSGIVAEAPTAGLAPYSASKSGGHPHARRSARAHRDRPRDPGHRRNGAGFPGGTRPRPRGRSDRRDHRIRSPRPAEQRVLRPGHPRFAEAASRASSARFTGMPHAKPARPPAVLTTRWQGTKRAGALRAHALAAARTARGVPERAASSV
jgi:short-subunit dehydrogenase involved in D-alanine esterification of teichoic acids